MNLSPLIQEMQIITVTTINPADGLLEKMPLRPLRLGTLRRARLRAGPRSTGYRKSHIGGQLTGSLIGRQAEQERSEPDHVALLLTTEANKVLIDLHAWRFVIVKRAAHHAVPVHFIAVMFGRSAASSLFFYPRINVHCYHLLSISRIIFERLTDMKKRLSSSVQMIKTDARRRSLFCFLFLLYDSLLFDSSRYRQQFLLWQLSVEQEETF